MAKATSRSTKKNKLGVKNSLVNNINARKKKGASRTRRKSTISKENYDDMEHNWDRPKKSAAKKTAKKSTAKKKPAKKSGAKKKTASKKSAHKKSVAKKSAPKKKNATTAKKTTRKRAAKR